MTNDLITLAFLQQLGPLEYGIIAVVLLLLFGRRLPEVGRSLGQGIVQFKRGLKDITDEVDQESSRGHSSAKPPLSSGHEQRAQHSAEEQDRRSPVPASEGGSSSGVQGS